MSASGAARPLPTEAQFYRSVVLLNSWMSLPALAIDVPVVHDPGEQDVIRLAVGAIDTARREGRTFPAVDIVDTTWRVR